MPTEDRPNFIIVYTDDQGYGDLSCMGDTHVRTPHLDALAASGARFMDWYSNSPVCSPSRASLMTGQYPAHAGVRRILAGARDTVGLPPGKPTIASALREEGYRTALFGKWHLGVSPEAMPHNFGFDEWFGFLAGCIDYFSHIFYWGQGRGLDPTHDLWENGQEVYANGQYFTEMVTERSVDFIQRAASDGEPFFLYAAYNAPHYPMHAPAKYMDRFSHLPWDRQVMAAMLSAVDDGVGDLVAALDRYGLRENTFIFFSADNGPSRETRNWLDGTPDPYYGGTTGRLRGHKSSLFDGGIREPAIMSWPGRIPAAQVISEVGVMMDIMPTFLSAAGADPSTYNLDGLDVLPMVADGQPSPHDAVFWEYGEQTALRRGDWKLVLNGVFRDNSPAPDPVHLANLAEDMGETTNLAEDQLDFASELKATAEQWRADIEEFWQEQGYGE